MTNLPVQKDNIDPATLDTLLDAFNSFLDVSQSTAHLYIKCIRIFFRYLDERNITAPQREDVIAWRDNFGKSVKTATIQLYLAGLRRFFSWLNAQGIYPDIVSAIKAPKLKRAFRRDALTVAQVQEILAAINLQTLKGLRDYAILCLMITTGMRDVEVARAMVADMGVVADSSVLFVQGKGRAGKDEYVKLSPFVEQKLRLWLKALNARNKNAPLFCSLSHNGYGCSLSTRSISRIVKESFRAIGLTSDRLSAHSLRHTTATLNLLHGGSLQETQQLLRHASIETTMIYNHSLQRAANDSELRISRAIFG